MGRTLEVKAGTPLKDVLFPYGVEFPCGGRGICRGCRIKCLEGNLPPTPEQESALTQQEIEQGWRLACLCYAENDLVLELEQWEFDVLSDFSSFPFQPREGYGIAIDVGTTTLAAQILDLQTGNVLSLASSLNPQAMVGGDIMSRIQYAITEKQQSHLVSLLRNEVEGLIHELLKNTNIDTAHLNRIALCGNTVMHHLFSNIDLTPLSHYPFQSTHKGLQFFTPNELGWQLHENTEIVFLPCPGGFVGSDILMGILASHMLETPSYMALVDLGTNGEIVIGNQNRIVCASTAAGPAFEGARISMGMRAASGAISHIDCDQDPWRFHIIGQNNAKGICGSGLVDAVAAGLKSGIIQSNGRLNNGQTKWEIYPPVSLIQQDIRELQLAKGAIAAGTRILLEHFNLQSEDLEKMILAGAFGNYINPRSALQIGLLRFPPEKISPQGNTALKGTKQVLFLPEIQEKTFQRILDKIEHISLNDHPGFQDIFIDEMLFPSP